MRGNKKQLALITYLIRWLHSFFITFKLNFIDSFSCVVAQRCCMAIKNAQQVKLNPEGFKCKLWREIAHYRISFICFFGFIFLFFLGFFLLHVNQEWFPRPNKCMFNSLEISIGTIYSNFSSEFIRIRLSGINIFIVSYYIQYAQSFAAL